VEPVVDWGAIAASVDLGDGWSAGSCGGGAPFVCIRKGGTPVGLVELARYPVDSITLPGFREAAARGDTVKALSVVVADLYESVRKDRAAVCGPGYSLETLPPEKATVSGGPGIRYGFTGKERTGKKGTVIAERQITYSTLRGGMLVVQSAVGYPADGCMPGEGGQFTPERLAEFAPVLERLVASSRLPKP
jgi:hypothetical protein